ncbi:MAG: hypothetical protein PF904_12750 [Kiritimatiellae bacterium]|jgi:hypothetical protein|nr:hypothetical protein [Kiritimatiellia bacterium]
MPAIYQNNILYTVAGGLHHLIFFLKLFSGCTDWQRLALTDSTAGALHVRVRP